MPMTFVEHVHCMGCGKRVSGTDPEMGLVVRAWVQCPECIEKAGLINTIYVVKGWSVERGDRAYVEANSPAAAFEVLAAELLRIDQTDGMTPREEWQAVEASRPLCSIVWFS